MKKKIVSGFLMMALLVSSMGTFVSCKDYDEDSYIDLRTRISDLNGKLEKWVSDIKSCTCNKELTESQIAALQAQAATLQNQIDALKAEDRTLADQIFETNNKIQQVKSELELLINNKVNEVSTNLQTIINETITQMNTQLQETWGPKLAEVKDSASLALTKALEVESKLAELDEKIAALDKKIQVWTVQDGYWYLNGEKTEYKALVKDGKDGTQVTIGADGYWYLDGEKTDKKAVPEDGKPGTQWTIGPDGYWYLDGFLYYDENGNPVSAIGTPGTPGTPGTQWTIVQESDGLYYWYEDGVKTEFLAQGPQGPKGDPGAGGSVDLEEITNNVLAKIDFSKYYTKEEVDKALQDAKDYTAKVEKIANEVKESLKNYVTIKDLSAEVVKLFTPGSDLTKACAEVMKEYFYTKEFIDKTYAKISEINQLKSDLKNQISGIIVQGTNNPVLGYLNTPFDARLNMLFAYFGVSDTRFAFPAQGGKWTEDEERFSDEDVEIMTNGTNDFSTVEGYVDQKADAYFAKDNGEGKVRMGSVYLTVNPDNVDFENQALTLETSNGEKSIVELQPAQKCSEKLTFGYGRTRADNGFYTATALMDIQKMPEIRLTINVDNAKSKIKSIYKNRSKNEAISLLVDLYKSLNGVYPAYCLRADMNDDTFGKRSVRSDYSIGITTVKPLSFNTLHLDRLKNLPGRDRIHNIIEKIINGIKVPAPELKLKTENWIKFTKVEGYASDGKTVTMTVSYETYINNVYDSDTKTIVFDGDIAQDLKEVLEVLAEAAAGEAQILQALVDTLNDFVDSWKDVWDNSINTAKEQIVNTFMQYIDKAYTKANNAFSLYTLFDINMVVYSEGKGMKFANEIVERATKMNTNEAILYPSSNTLEYLAPAYKKFVAVSNVYNAATKIALPKAEAMAKAAAANQGRNMGVVFDGDSTCTLKGEAGYIYEVSYAAVDYHGLKTCRKFYIRF